MAGQRAGATAADDRSSYVIADAYWRKLTTMARQLLTLETAKVSWRDRVALWGDALTAVCGPLRTDPLGSPLDGTMTFGPIGRLQLGHIAVSRHRIGLTPEMARAERHPVAKVIIQTAGVSV